MSRGIPRAVSMHMAQNAFARCAEKVNTRKNLTLNRQAVGEVVSYCTMIAANDTLDFNRDKQERLCTEMNHRAEVYTVEMSAYGQPKAREKLRERTAPMLDKPFVLPAGQYPRKQREKDALAERRAAGDLVIRSSSKRWILWAMIVPRSTAPWKKPEKTMNSSSNGQKTGSMWRIPNWAGVSPR